MTMSNNLHYGTETGTTTSSSIPAKSSGLAVYNGRPLAMAIAAIMASYDRAAVFRSDRRRDAATRPNALAAAASNGSGSKSASAWWTCACRAPRSAGSSVMSGPTESSARVTADISGSSGRLDGSLMRGNSNSVLVSSRPAGKANSNRRGDYRVEVSLEIGACDRRNRPPPRQKSWRFEGRPLQRPELGHGAPGPGHGDDLTSDNAFNHLSSVISKVSDRYGGHVSKLYHA